MSIINYSKEKIVHNENIQDSIRWQTFVEYLCFIKLHAVFA